MVSSKRAMVSLAGVPPLAGFLGLVALPWHYWPWVAGFLLCYLTLTHSVMGWGVGLLGLIALRFPGETLRWDDRRMQFANHKAASALVHPPYRKGWSLS